MIYYSAIQKGFFDPAIHGPQKIQVIDPAWQCPIVKIPDPDHSGDGEAPLIDFPDLTAVPDKIWIDNPQSLIPPDAVVITDDLYAQMLAAQESGQIIQAGENGLPVAAPPLQPSHDTLILSALKRVDDIAESTRLKFITGGAGQAMVYQRKVQEAETLALDPSPDNANYPLLAAEIDITGETIAEIAESVLAQRDAWLTVAAQIERGRLLAKSAIRNSTTKEQIDLVLADLAFPQPE